MLWTIAVILFVLWALGLSDRLHRVRVDPHSAGARDRSRPDSRYSGSPTHLKRLGSPHLRQRAASQRELVRLPSLRAPAFPRKLLRGDPCPRHGRKTEQRWKTY